MRVEDPEKMKMRMPGPIVARAFFEDAVENVAPRLLGKLLVRRTRAGVIAGRIVEVEAYLGPHHATPDAAAHSYRGPTPRNQVLFGPAGHAYVYSIYGMYFCMNITCEPAGRAGCILLRALEPVMGMARMARNRGLPALAFHQSRNRALPPIAQKMRKERSNRVEEEAARAAANQARALTSGPGRLCQALEITRARDNGIDLLNARSTLQVRDDGFRAGRVQVTARIGIRHAADLPLRFCLEQHGCVSGPKRMDGRVLVMPRSDLHAQGAARESEEQAQGGASC